VGSGSVEGMSKWVEYITSDNESPMADLRRKNGREEPWKVKFWGVGNENWGCGGHMSAEGYAENYRRYATYCRNYSGNNLVKIAGGPNFSDYHWMETTMKNISHHLMQGVSLHAYTMIGNSWGEKGSATQFNDKDYIRTLSAALYMETLIRKHSEIMDKYDPDKKIGLIVDEWGTWFDVEPGTNPGFLYQQNTLRDAITASFSLDIFNKYCDRVQMANIAQVVNVLQSLIHTQKEKMILTPTYHIFNMYKVHQDATLLPMEFKAPIYSALGIEVNTISSTASRDKNGKIHISVTNADLSSPVTISVS